MKISDITGIFSRRQLEFISAINVNEDYWVISLKPKKDLHWNAGEHGIFTMPGKRMKGRGWRVFSIASIPEEETVMIGTRTGEKTSEFKKILLGMKPGETVNLRGPFGWYKLHKDVKQIVLAATGVGITPNRAIAMELKKHPQINAELVHSGKYHLFKEDFVKITEEISNLKLHYTVDREATANTLNRLAVKYGNNAYYYVSGSIKSILSMKKLLKRAGVKGTKIINDPFLGY
ncbi:MAG: FAD-dependent oxidoreductase [Clostridia bacterium]|nr:FAD-dependent oxidoreductase [Clostridia bacterium]MBN2883364.1 FAD-dependent oxidoreductase [Clostridia bacterium]